MTLESQHGSDHGEMDVRIKRRQVWSRLWVSLALAMPAAIVSSQDAVNVADVEHVVAGSNPDKVWQPSDAQREAVVREASRYLIAKAERRYADAYAQFTREQQAEVPFEPFRASEEALRKEAGAALGRRLNRVTWYRDVPGSPPGVYAAVDYTGEFAELALSCGYVALVQQDDGSFGIVREEENRIGKRDAAAISPSQLEQLRAQFRCP